MERLKSPIPEVRYNALNELYADAFRKMQGIQKVMQSYQRDIRKLQDEALEEYKNTLLTTFYTDHQEEFDSGVFLPSTIKQIEVMDRIDKNGCYHFDGLQVQKADCNTCLRKNTCWGAEK